MEDSELNAIGIRHQTDKSSLCHNFLQLYERFVSPLRYDPITLLEIGVFGGGSLRTWADYFPRAKIVGVDIEPGAAKHRTDRVEVEIADQSNIEHLHAIASRYGPFDIVVDDGSHMWDHQITSLRYLFPSVKPGGLYILEDLDTSYGTHQPAYKGRAHESAARYLQRLSDAMVGDAVIDLNAEPDDFIRSYARRIDFMLFAKRTSITRRKDA